MSSRAPTHRSTLAFALVLLLGVAYGGCLGDEQTGNAVDGGGSPMEGTSGDDGTVIILGGDGDGDGSGDGDGDSAGDGDGDSIDVVSSNGG